MTQGLRLQPIENYEYLGDQQVLCPICNFEYVHFEPPSYYNSQDRGYAWSGRGDAIRIPCWCENGHQFWIVIGFHKGYSFIGYEPRKES
jgi:hypothetical protein